MLATFDKVYRMIRTPENYVPRDYQTIGGMWTVDTWKKGDVTVQMMDEGYTTRIVVDGRNLDVFRRWNAVEQRDYLHFNRGTEADLEELLTELQREGS